MCWIFSLKVVGNRATQDTFLKSQGKFFLSFLCTLFLHIFDTKKLQIKTSKKVSWAALFPTTDFEQVIFILLTLNRSKKTNSKTPVGETGYLCIFFVFRPLPHVTSTPPQLLRPVRASTGSELYPNTWLFFCFWTHRHPVFWFTFTP